MLSDCCIARVWIMCGNLKLSPKDHAAWNMIGEGRRPEYVCDECNKICGLHENKR